jgi:hypothetical protein
VLNGTGDTLLGFGANLLVEVATATGEATLYQVDGDGNYVPVAAGLPAAVAGSTVELAVPYLETGAGGSEAGLARPGAGDVIKLRAVVSEGEQRDVQVVPGGPAELVVPDLGLTRPVLHFNDPLGDDHGPGSYTYPTDAVFAARSYDLIEFSASEDDRNLIFRFDFAGPLNNEWGAPNGMGIHTLDVYLDVAEGGARKLLPGRNAALPEGSGWEFAIWAEGWTPGLYGPPSADSPGPQPIGDSDTLNIVSDPDARRITVRVPKQVLADSLGLAAEDLNPDAWGYLAVVLGQEGFPASGVWRVRDVDPTAAQFRFGGAPAESTTHTRIIDVAYPRGFVPSQELALSNFRPRNVSPAQFDALAPEDFAQLPMLSAQ